MSLLTVCQALAKNVGLSVPDQIIGSADREWIEATQYASEAGQELARRVDWNELCASTTITGDGTNLAHAMPSDFDRLQAGATAYYGATPLLPLSRPEWNGLTPMSGTPRYFLRNGSTITLWPYLADTETATISYQSKNWVGTSTEYLTDADVANIDEDTLIMALIVRWRRQKGMPFADYEAEYEATLAEMAGFNDGRRF